MARLSPCCLFSILTTVMLSPYLRLISFDDYRKSPSSDHARNKRSTHRHHFVILAVSGAIDFISAISARSRKIQGLDKDLLKVGMRRQRNMLDLPGQGCRPPTFRLG